MRHEVPSPDQSLRSTSHRMRCAGIAWVYDPAGDRPQLVRVFVRKKVHAVEKAQARHKWQHLRVDEKQAPCRGDFCYLCDRIVEVQAVGDACGVLVKLCSKGPPNGRAALKL